MSTEQNIYSFRVMNRISHAYHIFQNHTLVYLYGGRLHLRNQRGETLSIKKGDCAFIGRASYSHLYAEPEGKIPCRVLFVSLPREFLCEYYQTLPESDHKLSVAELSALHRLEPTPEAKSLFSVMDTLHAGGTGNVRRGSAVENGRNGLFLITYNPKIHSRPF